MLHASTRKLIDRLAEMTELGKLDWTEGTDGSINYSTEGYSVSLTEAPNELIITSKDGKELERASADELSATETEDNTPYTSVVATMTKEAARVARGTETAISTLLAGMQDAPIADPETVEETESLQEDVVNESAIDAVEPIDVAAEPAAVSEEDAAEEVTEAVSFSDPPASVPEADEPAEDAEEIVAETPHASEMANSGEPIEAVDETDTLEETATELETISEHETDASDTPVPVVASETEGEQEDVAADSETQEEETVSVLATDEMIREDEPTEASVQEVAASDDIEDAENAISDATLNIESTPDLIESTPDLDASLRAENEPDVSSESEPDQTAAEENGVTSFASQDKAAEGAPEPTESATEVTEAVARLADEVNTRDDDIGLETAAASAVGAVALAAGLTTDDQDDADEPAAEIEAQATEAVEAEVPPAYVPFGLTDSQPESSAEIEAEAEVEPEAIEPEQEILVMTDEPTSPEDDLKQAVDDAMTPRFEQVDLETETALGFEIESEADTSDVRDNNLISATPAPVLETVDAATETIETAASPEPVAASGFEPASQEDQADVTSEKVEAETPQSSYSLSGIGAGFGLGALSARTEASGIPGPSSVSEARGEKVVIDATDDVLPKLEGNLNVSLARTASAAMSAASVDNSAAKPSEDSDDADSDILKPRTRFNPWD